MELVQWAEQEARSRLSGSLPRRWAHVQAVAAEAVRIAPTFGDDGPMLVAAAMLHDVGYAPELVDTGFHPIDGARHLRRLDVGGRLCALVAHHSCAAREAEMRGLGGELAEFGDEASPVRDGLWYCDAVTGPGGERLTPEDRWAEVERRYGSEHLVTRFIRDARSELMGAVERTRARLTAAGIS